MVEFVCFNSFAKKVNSFGSIEAFDVTNDTKFRFRVRVHDLKFLDVFPCDSFFTIRKCDDYFLVTFDITVQEIKKVEHLNFI